MGCVLQVGQFVEVSTANKEDGQRTDEERADREAGHDDEDVGAQREGADDAVETEACIQYLQIDEAGEASPSYLVHDLLVVVTLHTVGDHGH